MRTGWFVTPRVQRVLRESTGSMSARGAGRAVWPQRLEMVVEPFPAGDERRDVVSVLGESAGALVAGDVERRDGRRIDPGSDLTRPLSAAKALRDRVLPLVEDLGQAAAEALIDARHLGDEVVHRTAQ